MRKPPQTSSKTLVKFLVDYGLFKFLYLRMSVLHSFYWTFLLSVKMDQQSEPQKTNPPRPPTFKKDKEDKKVRENYVSNGKYYPSSKAIRCQ